MSYDAQGFKTAEVDANGSASAWTYDALNRLWSVEKDGVQIDLRYYDGADRVMQSGPGGALPQQYANLINQGLTPDQMNGKEGRINRYDANGRLLHQRVLKSDNSAKLDISWDTNENVLGYVADGYDAAGNVVGYTVTNHDAGVVNEYTLTTKRFDSYQSAVTHGVSTKQLPGDSTQQYDLNGFLVGVVDSSQHANDRTVVNDATGHALYVNQGGNIQRQLVVNGEVLGTYGVGVDPNNPASGANNNPNFANVVDFDFGYARVSASYPSASPGAYTVRSGDTLQSIAQTAYGDGSLWFRIAEANGLASGNDLKVGQTLNIPNRVSTISNNASTFKPYDPSRIEGDKTPSLATPVPKKKHNWFAQLVQVVVAVAVAIFAPELLGITSSFWAGVVGGALGSAAGQLAGMAMGTQSSFDWKGVALGAIGGGMAGGFYGAAPLGGAVSSPANVVARAVMADALTQGIGVVTGLQQSFDWRSVAGAAAGAVAGAGFDPGVPGSEYAARYDDEGNLMPGAGVRDGTRFYSSEATSSMSFRAARTLNTVISTAARGLASVVGRGGQVGFEQVAVDAFGNALGEGLVDQASRPSTTDTGWSGGGIKYGTAGETGVQISGTTAVQWMSAVDRGVEAAALALDDNEPVTRDAMYRPRADDPYVLFTGAGGANRFDPRRYSGPSLNLVQKADGFFADVAGWSTYVGKSFDSAILDAASSGKDNWGRFLTGMRVVATASSDAMSGSAAMARLITNEDARNAFSTRVGQFLDDPIGSVGRAFDAWASKPYYEQIEDVYKVFQTGAAGMGIAGKAKGLFSVTTLDGATMLGANTQRVLTAYQSAYNDAAAAFEQKLAAHSIEKPANLNFTTWAGGQIDNAARAEMNAFKQLTGMDDLIVNQRLYVPDGIKGYRVPDLMVPGERTIIDGTIGTKGLTTPQIQDFFASGKVDRVILVAPNKNPVMITLEQYLRSK